MMILLGDSDSSQSGQTGGGTGSQFGVIAADHESGEEDDEDGDLVTENSEFVSCLHQGKIYRDGESFTANVSGLPISGNDQCMQCVCQASDFTLSLSYPARQLFIVLHSLFH
jgi:hypothetical protein